MPDFTPANPTPNAPAPVNNSTPAPSAAHNPAAQAEADARKLSNLWNYFLGIVAAAAVILVVWGGLAIGSEISQRELSREYLSLQDDAGRAAFVKRHLNHPLGGLVLLSQAHKYYQESNYAAAQSAYEQVLASGLKSQPILQEQAALGKAFATYALDTQKGLAELKALAMNTSLMQSTRAYAAHELAGYWAQKGEWKQAKDYVTLLKTLKDIGPWERQAQMLEDIYPQLGVK